MLLQKSMHSRNVPDAGALGTGAAAKWASARVATAASVAARARKPKSGLVRTGASAVVTAHHQYGSDYSLHNFYLPCDGSLRLP